MPGKEEYFEFTPAPETQKAEIDVYDEKSKKNKCDCSVTYRPNEMAMNFRLLAIAMSMLFGLCVLLFIWNVVLWRELDGLQSEISNLKKNLEEVTSSKNNVRHASSKRRRVSEIKKREKHKHGYRRKRIRELMKKGVDTVLRSKRSTAQEIQPSIPESFMLSRMKRAKRMKTRSGSGRKRGRRGQTTAFHVKIKGELPYNVTKSDADGILHSWNVREAFNKGFALAELNDEGKNAGVKVLKSGVYYIYSQITFKMTSGVEVHEKIKIGVRGVSDVAACTTSFPRDHSPNDYITCHSSGLVYLPAKTKFLVQIHPPSLEVFNNPSYTYFGAFMVGS